MNKAKIFALISQLLAAAGYGWLAVVVNSSGFQDLMALLWPALFAGAATYGVVQSNNTLEKTAPPVKANSPTKREDVAQDITALSEHFYSSKCSKGVELCNELHKCHYAIQEAKADA